MDLKLGAIFKHIDKLLWLSLYYSCMSSAKCKMGIFKAHIPTSYTQMLQNKYSVSKQMRKLRSSILFSSWSSTSHIEWENKLMKWIDIGEFSSYSNWTHFLKYWKMNLHSIIPLFLCSWHLAFTISFSALGVEHCSFLSPSLSVSQLFRAGKMTTLASVNTCHSRAQGTGEKRLPPNKEITQGERDRVPKIQQLSICLLIIWCLSVIKRT